MKYFGTCGLVLTVFNILSIILQGNCDSLLEECVNKLSVFKKCNTDKDCPNGLSCGEAPCLTIKSKMCIESGKAVVCPKKGDKCTYRTWGPNASTKCTSHSDCSGKLLCCECPPSIFQCMEGIIDKKLGCPKHDPKISCQNDNTLSFAFKERAETCKSNEDCRGNKICCPTQCLKEIRQCVKGVPVSEITPTTRKPTPKTTLKTTPEPTQKKTHKPKPTQKPTTKQTPKPTPKTKRKLTSKEIPTTPEPQTPEFVVDETSGTMSITVSTLFTIANTETIPETFQDYVEVCPSGCAKDGNFILSKIQTCNADSDCPQKQKCCSDACWTESNFCKPISIIYNITIPGGKCPDNCIKDQVPFPLSVMLCDENTECAPNLECCLDRCYETNICKSLVYK